MWWKCLLHPTLTCVWCPDLFCLVCSYSACSRLLSLSIQWIITCEKWSILATERQKKNLRDNSLWLSFPPGLLIWDDGSLAGRFIGRDWLHHRPGHSALWLHWCGDHRQCHPAGQAVLLVSKLSTSFYVLNWKVLFLGKKREQSVLHVYFMRQFNGWGLINKSPSFLSQFHQ